MKSNQTFSILIWANKAKQDNKGLLPLYARITIDGQRVEISLKRKVESSKWKAQSGFLKGNSSEVRLVNQYIGQLQNQLFSLYQQLLINQETITAQALKERFLGVQQQRKMLLEIFGAQIQFDDIHAKKGYSRRKAYGQSKRACLIFAYELQRRLSDAGYHTLSVAAHPGLCKTNLDQYFPALIRPLGNLFLQPAKKGALPVLYAALEKDIKGGEFIGPDGFQELRGYPKRVDSDEYSKDTKVAHRLWKASQEMAKIHYLTEEV